MAPRCLLLAVLAVVAACLLFSGCAAAATVECDLYASPAGSDTSPGTAAAPLQSVGRLAQVLRPGQVGCLAAGTYQGEGGAYEELKISTPGITIASTPGEIAEIDARIWIAEGADGVSFERLVLNGANSKNLPSPTVNADDAAFREDEVTNGHTTICFDLGNVSWGKARGTAIEDSTIHGCGEEPSTNQEHGIYLSDAEDTVIRGNWIYDNVDRGIQLYPDAQNTVITENVIYGNGEGIIFSGNEEVAASGSIVTHNLIGDSQIRHNLESSYPAGGPHGVNNEVRENCVFGATSAYYAGSDGSGIQRPEVGFSVNANLVAAPQFVNAAAGELELAAGSPCTGVLGAAAAARPGPPGAAPVAPGPLAPSVGVPALTPSIGSVAGTATEAPATAAGAPESVSRATPLGMGKNRKRARRLSHRGKTAGKRAAGRRHVSRGVARRRARAQARKAGA
jgi:parallel beta-helix repeat protein